MANNKPITADSTDEAVNQIAKNKRNRPDLANFGQEHVKPGDNARYLRLAMASLKLPPIDISDPKQVEQRIGEYFKHCVDNDRKPQIVGLGNWLGVHRDTINSWMRGECRADSHSDLIKKAVEILHELWVDYMQNGKINPASGIFLGKNMFGYKDVQDVVLSPGNALGDSGDPATIADKYRDALPPATIDYETE